MRTSINIMPEGPVSEICDIASVAEDLGFGRCWVFDEGLAARDVYVTLTAIGAATESLEIGPGITNPFTRHPATTAAAISTLDDATDGRAFLGIGAGGSLTLDSLGIDRRRSLTAVRECIDVARDLFTGAPVDYEGTTVSLGGAVLEYGRPSTEIWLAGRGPKMLALGGRSADGVMLEFIHRELLADQFRLVVDAGESVGRTPRLSYSTMVVTDDYSMHLTKMHMTYRLVDSPDHVQRLVGMTATDIASIREAMADGLDSAAELVREDWVLPFVVHGTPAECSQQLSDLEQQGVEEFLIPIFDLGGAVDLMKSVAAVVER